METSSLDLGSQCRKFSIVLISLAGIIGIGLFSITFIDLADFAGDILLTIASCVAAILASHVVSRQGIRGFFGRTYGMLFARIALWAIGEVLWTYLRFVLGEDFFPSIADVFYLAGFIPLAGFSLGMYRFFGKRVSKWSKVAVISGSALITGFICISIVNSYILSGESTHVVQITLALAYPILDMVIAVPALLLLTRAGRGQLTSIPWVIIGFLLIVGADTEFAIQDLEGQSSFWIANVLWILGYVGIILGIIWHGKFFITSIPKTESSGSK